MRRQVQVVFQSPAGSIRPRMKVGAFLREPLIRYRLCPRREVEAEVVRLLEKVGLPGPVRDRYPGELSGGELQRVTIARAVAVKPDLLICDEPTSALDPAVQTEIADLLHETAAETGAAMLLITHDLALASRLAGGWRSSTKAACWSCCRRRSWAGRPTPIPAPFWRQCSP